MPLLKENHLQRESSINLALAAGHHASAPTFPSRWRSQTKTTPLHVDPSFHRLSAEPTASISTASSVIAEALLLLLVISPGQIR
ncbi:hypothetical protein U1Q18_045014 [Sarracenia purpurea var. burkii]